MKKIAIIIGVLLSITIPLWVMASSTGSFSMTSGGHYQEMECQICGKLLREWVDDDLTSNVIWSDGRTTSITLDEVEITIGRPLKIKPLEKVKVISWRKHLTVCGFCQGKFKQEIQNRLDQEWNTWLSRVISTSLDRKKEMKEEKRIRLIQQLRGELRDFKQSMEKKIKGLTGP